MRTAALRATMMVQLKMGIPGNNISNTIAVPPTIPPSWMILKKVRMNTTHKDQEPFPILLPGRRLNDFMVVSPVQIACFPYCNCTATLIRQLKIMIQKAAKPALAPNMVVAINSPDPTMEADKIKPGPKNFKRSINLWGGSWIVDSEMRYGSLIKVKF